MKTYTEHRTITTMALRYRCIEYGWLSHGSIAEHKAIFSLLRDDLGHPAHMSIERLAIIAENIKAYSETECEIEDIMSALAHISISYFMPAPIKRDCGIAEPYPGKRRKAMKRYYIETDGHNMVAYVDDSGRAFVLTDSIDNNFSTFAAAKNHDYAEIDGMTIDEMDCSIGMAAGCTNNFIVDDFDINDSSHNSIQEF